MSNKKNPDREMFESEGREIVDFRGGVERLKGLIGELSGVFEMEFSGEGVTRMMLRTRAETIVNLLRELPTEPSENLREYRRKALEMCRGALESFRPRDKRDESSLKKASELIEQLKTL